MIIDTEINYTFYLDIKYKDSFAFSLNNRLSREFLIFKLTYIDNAIDFHYSLGNKKQEEFFTDQKEHILKRLQELEK